MDEKLAFNRPPNITIPQAATVGAGALVSIETATIV